MLNIATALNSKSFLFEICWVKKKRKKEIYWVLAFVFDWQQMHYANQEAAGKLSRLRTFGYSRKNWIPSRQDGRCSVILNYTWFSFINTPSLLHWTNKQTSVIGCFCFMLAISLQVIERDTNLTMICPSSLLVFWACDRVGSGCECRTGVPWGPVSLWLGRVPCRLGAASGWLHRGRTAAGSSSTSLTHQSSLAGCTSQQLLCKLEPSREAFHKQPHQMWWRGPESWKLVLAGFSLSER